MIVLYTQVFADSLSFIGVAAFAASGAMAGVERKTDLLGVIILAATTATGGGVMRDILLGFTPPKIFLAPTYFFIAVLVALILFAFAYFNGDEYYKRAELIDKLNNIFDALGLGIFVALGTQTAIDSGYGKNMFLSVMIGTLTGVGGGFFRDIMILRIPVILRKHIYASSALLGSVVFYLLHTFSVCYSYSLITSASVTFILRMLATHFKWNLPKIYL